MHMNALRVISLFLWGASATGWSKDICQEHRPSQWMAVSELRIVLSALGYHICHLQVSQGCYVMEGVTRDGKLRRLYLDTATGEVMASVMAYEAGRSQENQRCGYV